MVILFDKSFATALYSIQVAQRARAKYFKPGDKLPKKYQNENYRYENVLINRKPQRLLIDLITNTPVVKNSKTAGEPRFLNINMQHIWQGDRFARQRYMDFLKQEFKTLLNPYRVDITVAWMDGLLDSDLETFVCCRLFFNIPQNRMDVFNFASIRVKALEDVLQDLEILKNDSTRYYRGTSYLIDEELGEEEMRIQLIMGNMKELKSIFLCTDPKNT